ncbi:hypothetical protein HMPREF1550_01753 [Actinomyces sp. oral taxon 877 str. F0543]|nr:hypothetical protein HMPREF1550_01753 [Actinomyces sp. oral taxon 877 str. F0543]
MGGPSPAVRAPACGSLPRGAGIRSFSSTFSAMSEAPSPGRGRAGIRSSKPLCPGPQRTYP